MEEIWGNVTDPEKHDSNQYRYLVHAFNPSASASIKGLSAMTALAKNQLEHNPSDKSAGDQSVNLSLYPEKLNERVSLSMSLIDQDHRGTWGKAGIIVEAPEDNIVATSSSDAGSLNSDVDFLKSQFREPPMNGDDLLEITGPETYNEVVALAKTGDSPLTLKGFFYTVAKNGEVIDEDLAQKVKNQAARLNLPIIEILSPQKERAVTNDGIELSVTEDKKLFTIVGKEGMVYSDFTKCDYERDRLHFMTPDELEMVLVILENHGVEDIDKHRRRYDEAAKEHFRAKFIFDDEGNVKSLEKVEGYGKEEVKYEVVGEEGYARRYNTEIMIKHMAKAMSGDNSFSMMRSDPYIPITEQKVLEMAEEAMAELNDEQKAVAEKWVERVMPGIEERSRESYGRRSNSELLFRPLSLSKPLTDYPKESLVNPGAGKLSLESKNFELGTFLRNKN